MQKQIQRLLQINAGELALVALTAALFFFWDAGREIGSQTITALFISRAGSDKLPYMYIALGLSSMVVTSLFSAGQGRNNPKSYFRVVAVILAALIVFLYLQVPRLSELESVPASIFNVPAIYPSLWLLVNIGGTLLATMAWSLAGQLMDARQARRLFSLLASAGLSGAALAAISLRFLSSIFSEHVATLLLFQVAAIAIGIGLLSFLPNAPDIRDSERTPTPNAKTGAVTVLRSPLLRLLALSLLLFSILFLTIDLMFNNTVNLALEGERSRLDFLASTSSMIQILTLLTSVFLTGRLIKKWGVVNMNFFLIGAYLLGFSALAFSPGLLSAALARILQMVSLGGIVQSSNYIFFNVIPAEKRSQAISFTFGVVGQTGVVLSGILLLIGNFFASPTLLPILGITLALVTAWITFKMRDGYRRALVTALRSGTLEFFTTEDSEHPQPLLATDTSAVSFLLNSLNDPNPIARKLGVEMIGELRISSGLDGLIKSKADPEAEVRAAALKSLHRLQHNSTRRWAQEFLHDPQPLVVATAIEILSQYDQNPDTKTTAYLTRKLKDPDLDVRLAAVSYFASRGNITLCRKALDSIIANRDPDVRSTGLSALGTLAARVASLGLKPAGLVAPALLGASLKHPIAGVRRAACAAAAALPTTSLLPQLLALFDDNSESVRVAAARAVRGYGLRAERRILTMLAKSDDNEVLESALIALPPDKTRHAKTIEDFAIRETGRLKIWRQRAASLELPGRAAQLLHEILTAEIAHSEVRLIRALQVLEPEDADGWESIIEQLNRSNAEKRSAILEALDTLGDTSVAKNIVLPALEIGAQQKGYAEDETNLHPSAALQDLLRSQERWTRAVAIATAAELDFTHLIPEIKVLARARDPIVKEAAVAGLNRLQKGKNMARKSIQTLSSVQRIILLRQVPLFSSLAVNDLKYLAEIAVEKVLQSGDHLVKQHDPGDELFIIAEGEVSVWLHTGKKEEQVSTGKEGDFFGEMAVLDSAPRSASILCTTPVRVLMLEGRAFRQILRDRPEVALTVLRGLSQRIRHANELLKPQIDDKTRAGIRR